METVLVQFGSQSGKMDMNEFVNYVKVCELRSTLCSLQKLELSDFNRSFVNFDHI